MWGGLLVHVYCYNFLVDIFMARYGMIQPWSLFSTITIMPNQQLHFILQIPWQWFMTLIQVSTTNVFWNNFGSTEAKCHVSFCHHLVSIVCPSCMIHQLFHILVFFCKTSQINENKVNGRDCPFWTFLIRNYYGENSVNIRQKLFLSDQQVNCYNVFCAVSFYVDLDL